MHDEAVARSILAAIWQDPRSVALEAIGDGFASDAWLVRPRDGEAAVLRVANDRGLVDDTYEMEHALMGRLHARGAAVPAPIVGSWAVDGWAGPAFSLTTRAPGVPMRPETVPRSVPAIQGFLAVLHDVPAAGGYGPLVVGQDGELRGRCDDLVEGLVTWADRPLWPLDGSRLADHPAIGEHPALVKRMEARTDEVRTALRAASVGILHSDLHEENILDDDGHLTFIDFGEALVGPLAWDIAAVGFFIDWSIADAVAEDDPELLAQAARIGLCFGAYRWHLSREHAFDDDEHDRTYLETCLRRIDAG